MDVHVTVPEVGSSGAANVECRQTPSVASSCAIRAHYSTDDCKHNSVTALFFWPARTHMHNEGAPEFLSVASLAGQGRIKQAGHAQPHDVKATIIISL